MKLNHLTFGQLYKLAHPTTLMRVTRAYHNALYARVENATVLVAEAEKECSWVCPPYKKVLAFLQGPELKAALRKAAAEQDIPHVPGAALELCRIPQRSPQIMRAHANMVYTFVKLAGGVPIVWEEGGDKPHQIRVLVDTTPLGIAALTYRPGLKVKTLQQECRIENTFLFSVFWWLNLVDRLRDDDRVNPSVWPVNTPDVATTAETLITRNAQANSIS